MEEYEIVITCNDGLSNANLQDLIDAIHNWIGVNKVELKKTTITLPPGTCPYCRGSGDGQWSNGEKFHVKTKCLFCRGTGKTA